jgi:hypothetical protein
LGQSMSATLVNPISEQVPLHLYGIFSTVPRRCD